MTTGGTNLLLRAGLAMIALSILLAFAGNVYARRVAGDPGARQGQARGEPAPDVKSIAEAREAVEGSLRGYGHAGLEVAEVMEFANNYYAEIRERDTGIGAMEILVDKRTGRVYPEPGPNMMWNTRYGMMGGHGLGTMNGQPLRRGSATAAAMTVGPERAVEIADGYLARHSPGATAGEAEEFHGYHTLHTEKDGEITGMLSVNGYSGEVWYHYWHGPFVAMEEAQG